jgi:hypothetical protein
MRHRWYIICIISNFDSFLYQALNSDWAQIKDVHLLKNDSMHIDDILRFVLYVGVMSYSYSLVRKHMGAKEHLCIYLRTKYVFTGVQDDFISDDVGVV